jgi:hypothetical protein
MAKKMFINRFIILFYGLKQNSDFCDTIIQNMAKFTPAFLKKLEDLLKEQGYEVRYEKGNFKSGYCVLEAKKVVVINKFSTLESRIQALIEIIIHLTNSGEINADLRSVGLKNPILSSDNSNQKEISFDAEVNEPASDSNSLTIQ